MNEIPIPKHRRRKLLHDRNRRPSTRKSATRHFGLRPPDRQALRSAGMSTMQLSRNRFVYSGRSSTPCYKRTDYPLQTKSASVYTASVLIQFPAADSPKLSSGLDITAQVMDGNLEGIGFNTAGVRDGEKVLESL